MNLYRVVLRGLSGGLGGGTDYQTSYVVADSAEAAYQAVRAFVDKEDLGMCADRALDHVALVAEDARFPECTHRLFFAQKTRFVYDEALAKKTAVLELPET